MRKKIPVKAIEYNPVNDPKNVHGYKMVRFVENPSLGLRRIGFSDEICKRKGSRRIDHKGWFTEDGGDNGETYRGVVFQLPARDGKPQYIYGYEDSMNDEGALLCFDVETDEMDAAIAADNFAEIFAEDARDYQRAWQAGRRCEDLNEEIKSMRREALAIGEEMRAAKVANVVAPTICATLRGQIKSLYHNILKARKERDNLVSDYGRREGFAE